jgi:hypothetical protein
LVFDDGPLLIMYSEKILENLLIINKLLCAAEHKFMEARELRVIYSNFKTFLSKFVFRETQDF